jgi:hypothetical protein
MLRILEVARVQNRIINGISKHKKSCLTAYCEAIISPMLRLSKYFSNVIMILFYSFSNLKTLNGTATDLQQVIAVLLAEYLHYYSIVMIPKFLSLAKWGLLEKRIHGISIHNLYRTISFWNCLINFQDENAFRR